MEQERDRIPKNEVNSFAPQDLLELIVASMHCVPGDRPGAVPGRSLGQDLQCGIDGVISCP